MKATVISIIIAVSFIGLAIMFSGNSRTGDETLEAINNVSVVDGKQIIEIGAKGGYSPRVTNAKADIPTTIKMETRGTFDCSSALAIPDIGYRNFLPPSGITEIDVPAQESGTEMRGLCSMGMYSFTINFN